MKLSHLLAELQKIYDEHGDVERIMVNGWMVEDGVEFDIEYIPAWGGCKEFVVLGAV